MVCFLLFPFLLLDLHFFWVVLCMYACIHWTWRKLGFWSLWLEQLTKVTDTTAAQARKGKDIQGIPWESLNISRERYRLTRLEQYRNFENILKSGDAVDKVFSISVSFFWPLFGVVWEQGNGIRICLTNVLMFKVYFFFSPIGGPRSASKSRRVGITMNSSIIQEWLSLLSFIFRFVDFFMCCMHLT